MIKKIFLEKKMIFKEANIKKANSTAYWIISGLFNSSNNIDENIRKELCEMMIANNNNYFRNETFESLKESFMIDPSGKSEFGMKVEDFKKEIQRNIDLIVEVLDEENILYIDKFLYLFLFIFIFYGKDKYDEFFSIFVEDIHSNPELSNIIKYLTKQSKVFIIDLKNKVLQDIKNEIQGELNFYEKFIKIKKDNIESIMLCFFDKYVFKVSSGRINKNLRIGFESNKKELIDRKEEEILKSNEVKMIILDRRLKVNEVVNNLKEKFLENEYLRIEEGDSLFDIICALSKKIYYHSENFYVDMSNEIVLNRKKDTEKNDLDEKDINEIKEEVFEFIKEDMEKKTKENITYEQKYYEYLYENVKDIVFRTIYRIKKLYSNRNIFDIIRGMSEDGVRNTEELKNILVDINMREEEEFKKTGFGIKYYMSSEDNCNNLNRFLNYCVVASKFIVNVEKLNCITAGEGEGFKNGFKDFEVIVDNNTWKVVWIKNHQTMGTFEAFPSTYGNSVFKNPELHGSKFYRNIEDDLKRIDFKNCTSRGVGTFDDNVNAAFWCVAKESHFYGTYGGDIILFINKEKKFKIATAYKYYRNKFETKLQSNSFGITILDVDVGRKEFYEKLKEGEIDNIIKTYIHIGEEKK